MSDDPASKEAFRWEVARGLLADLRHEWPGMGEMANEQRRRAAAAIEEMMATVEAWQQAMKKAERDIAQLRTERDEARREACESDTETHGGALLEAKRRGWDCFQEKS